MAYIGNTPAEAFSAFQKQDFTTSATTSYTLDHPVSNQNEIALFINFVRQEPTAAYTASGTSLTLTSATTSSDDMYCVYLGKAVQTVNPPSGSVGSSQVAASIITGQTAETSIATDDTVLIHDTSAGALRKMTRANFVSGVGGTNTPYFYGELASDATLTRATTTKVTGMTNDELDSATAFDGTTFTVPSGQGGKYYIEGMITGDYGGVGQDGEQTIAFLYKNGSEIKSTKIQQSSASGQNMREVTVPISGLFNLSAGDTVELYAYLQDASGGNAVLQADYGRTSFMGYKLVE